MSDFRVSSCFTTGTSTLNQGTAVHTEPVAAPTPEPTGTPVPESTYTPHEEPPLELAPGPPQIDIGEISPEEEAAEDEWGTRADEALAAAGAPEGTRVQHYAESDRLEVWSDSRLTGQTAYDLEVEMSERGVSADGTPITYHQNWLTAATLGDDTSYDPYGPVAAPQECSPPTVE